MSLEDQKTSSQTVHNTDGADGAHMPGASRSRSPQHQVRDVLLFVPPPLEDRRKLVAKVCVGVQQRVEKNSHRVPRPSLETFTQILQVLQILKPPL